ncbi:unnamed protein product [Moneuplotes crassus]|uniref:Uncharacterized protein n=1 Tax=Euplotes crassus TaxID=5936 RepID=A0AAD1XXQ8_EUPCR|nr:unnamed protein product [Moneuplotes crassus]
MKHDIKRRRVLLERNFVLTRGFHRLLVSCVIFSGIYKYWRSQYPKEYRSDEEEKIGKNPMTMRVLLTRVSGYVKSTFFYQFTQSESQEVFLPDIKTPEKVEEEPNSSQKEE